MNFDYEKPDSVEAIVDRLARHEGMISILAGGTDLMSQLRSRVTRPSLVLDIKGPEELRSLEKTGEGLSIGAAVIFNRLLEERDLAAPYAALIDAASHVASYQIRNRATLVGNVSNASPCADSVPPLCVLDGEVELQGPGGLRRIPVVEFILGNRETRRAPDEIVTRILVPAPGEGTWSGFLKRKRVKGHDLALASAALLRDPERRRLRLSIGSCSPSPALVELDEMYDRPDADEAVRRIQDKIRPIDDVRASIEYRRDMVALMVRRLFAAMSAAS